MKNLILLVCFLLGPAAAMAQADAPAPAPAAAANPVYVPENGMVPDEDTAIRIAEAVWIPIYGEKKVLEEQPYMATLNDKVWDVTSVSNAALKDGTFHAQISKTDGRIIALSHSE